MGILRVGGGGQLFVFFVGLEWLTQVLGHRECRGCLLFYLKTNSILKKKHPIFNPASPTTPSSYLSVARGDTKRGCFFWGGGVVQVSLGSEWISVWHCPLRTVGYFELELELVQTHMTQKPILRVEMGERVDSRNRQAQRIGYKDSSLENVPPCEGGGAPLYWLFSLQVGSQVPLRPPFHSAIFFSLIRLMLARPCCRFIWFPSPSLSSIPLD